MSLSRGRRTNRGGFQKVVSTKTGGRRCPPGNLL